MHQTSAMHLWDLFGIGQQYITFKIPDEYLAAIFMTFCGGLQGLLHVCFPSWHCTKPGMWNKEKESLKLPTISKKRAKTIDTFLSVIIEN